MDSDAAYYELCLESILVLGECAVYYRDPTRTSGSAQLHGISHLVMSYPILCCYLVLFS